MANLVERQIGPGPVPVWDIQTASASQIDACCGLGRGVNLLDNAYWVSKQCIINQRKQSAYTVNGNSIDRWRSGSIGSTGSLTLDDNGITLSHPSGDSGLTDIFQRLLYIPNGVYTFSVLTADNVLLSVSGDFSEQAYTRLGNLRVLMHPNNGGYKAVQFQIIDGGTVRPLAAKLELGPVQTLAHKEGDTWVLNDPPPNYQQELIKCQKYLVNLKPSSLTYQVGGYIIGGRIGVNIPLSTPMVGNPAGFTAHVRIATVSGKIELDTLPFTCWTFNDFPSVGLYSDVISSSPPPDYTPIAAIFNNPTLLSCEL